MVIGFQGLARGREEAQRPWWWGDTIGLRIEIQHEINLSNVRAVFRRRGAIFELGLGLRGSDHLRLMEWRREEKISEALLEAEVNDRGNYPAADSPKFAHKRSPRGNLPLGEDGIPGAALGWVNIAQRRGLTGGKNVSN